MIKIEGQYTFQLPIQDVYDALRDEALLRFALPGKVYFKMTSPTHYEAAMDLDVPKFGGHYAGALNVTDTEVPTYYDLSAHGEALGRQITATGRVELKALSPVQTEVHYLGETDAFDDFNRFIRMAAPPVAARLANRGLAHLEEAIQRHQQAQNQKEVKL